MAFIIADRVKENTSSTGVEGVTLLGAPTGFQAFGDVLSSGDTTYYAIEENDLWEVGFGTYGSDNLDRNYVIASSNSDSKINLGGSGVVFITYPAGRAVYRDGNSQVVVGASGLLFSNDTVVKDAKLAELYDVSVNGTITSSNILSLDITDNSLLLGEKTGPSNNGNVLIGHGAGSGLTTGYSNTILGSDAATVNQAGYKNVHIGHQSGPSTAGSSTAVYNAVSVGYQAGNKMRHEAVAIGHQAAIHTYEIGFVAIGDQVGSGIGSYSVAVGKEAARNLTDDYTVSIGYQAGYSAGGEDTVWVGRGAGHSSSTADRSIGLGKNAGKSSTSDDSIYIGFGAGQSNTTDDLLFIGNNTPSSQGSLIKGDMTNKRLAIGVADITLADTLHVNINTATDRGIVVKGAASQSADLTRWTDVSDGLVAAVSKSGVMTSYGLFASGAGVQLADITPSVTDNAIYNVGGTLYFNGSALAGTVTTTQLNYVSGVAIYASGQVNVTTDGTAEASKALILDSNKSFTGIKDGIFNQYDAWVKASGVNVGNSGVVLASNTPGVTTNTLYNVGGSLYFNGSALGGGASVSDLTYVSGIAVYSSGQAIENEGLVTYASGQAIENEGIATYASGQAIANETDIVTASGALRTDITSNTTIATYASGEALSLNAASGIASYASGEALSLNAASGIAAYASGQVNVSTDGTAEASKALILDSAKSFTGVKNGIFNQTDSFVQTSGLYVGASGIGIGISRPQKLVHIYGADDELLRLSDSTASDDASVRAYMQFYRGENTNRIGYVGFSANNALELATVYDAGQLRIKTGNNVEALIVSSGQQMGLGTSSPVYKLDVAGHDALVQATGVIVGASGIAMRDADLSHTITIKTPNVVSTSFTLPLPSGMGSNGQVLTTDSVQTYWSTAGAGDVTTAQLTYVSGIAVYASGESLSLNAASGIANYASGQAIENEGLATYASGEVISLNAASGIAAYASGNTANITFGSNAQGDILYHNGTNFTRLAKGTDNYVLTMDGNNPNWEAAGSSSYDDTYVSGVATYASGESISLNVASGIANYASGEALSLNVASGVANYASGQAIENETAIATNVSNISTNTTNITSTTAVANYASGESLSLNAASGIANYASGQAIANEADIVTASGALRTDITSNTTIATYASGEALSLNAASGIANYASGQAIENETAIATNTANIATNVTNITSTTTVANYASGEALSLNSASGIAVYASGQVNVSAAGTATASKALVLDSAKSFTGVKDGTFNQFDSWVYTSGVNVGASGIVMRDADLSHTITVKTPDVVSTSFTLPLPSGMGSNGQVLTTDSVQTYWSTAGGGDVSTAQFTYVSGVAAYASGQAIENEGIATYASGEVISLNAASGIATYASGEALSLNAASGIATYASGQVNVSAAGTAIANKAVVLDGSKNIATIGTIGCGAITSTGTSTFGHLKVGDAGNIGSASDADAIAISSGGVVTFSQATKPALKANSDGATVTFDLNVANVHTVTLGGNRTFAISNETAGQKFIIRVLQDGTGSRLVSTWFSTIKWAGGSAPTLTTTAGKADVFGFLVTGTDTYDGFVIGQNI